MYIVKVTICHLGGWSVNKYYFDSPSDALNFALNHHAEMMVQHELGFIEYCAIAFICPEIGCRGWED